MKTNPQLNVKPKTHLNLKHCLARIIHVPSDSAHLKRVPMTKPLAVTLVGTDPTAYEIKETNPVHQILLTKRLARINDHLIPLKS